MIHCWSASPTSRSARIFGSATLTIVPSTNTTADPRMQAIRVSRLARASTPCRLACRPRMDRRVALIVNPVAGGGRARKRLPVAEAELRTLGVDFHREETSSLVNAEQLARDAAAAGEAVFTLGGDGLVGAVAG